VGVVSVPLAVAVFDQQAGFLDPVVVSVAGQQPACPCEGDLAVSRMVLAVSQVRGEPVQVDAQQLPDLASSASARSGPTR